jgi:hypothetical protein
MVVSLSMGQRFGVSVQCFFTDNKVTPIEHPEMLYGGMQRA